MRATDFLRLVPTSLGRPDIYFSAFGPDPSWDEVSPEASLRVTTMTRSYAEIRREVLARYPEGATPGGVSVDDIVQLRLQNTFDTHLDIARGDGRR